MCFSAKDSQLLSNNMCTVKVKSSVKFVILAFYIEKLYVKAFLLILKCLNLNHDLRAETRLSAFETQLPTAIHSSCTTCAKEKFYGLFSHLINYRQQILQSSWSTF